MYQYDNKQFTSVKALADYVGMNEKTLAARLRKKVPIEEACNPILRGRRYVENETIASLARRRGLEPPFVYNRLKYGYTYDKAFNTPKKITRQGKPIIVKGIRYPSIITAARELGIENKIQIIRRRLKHGIDPDQAFLF